MARNNRPEGTRAPNGASSIYLGGDGKWHGRVTVGVRDDGKPDRRHIERKTEAEVIRAVRELEKQRDGGKVRKAGRAWTVEKWLTHWVENIAAPTVRRTTMVGYRSSVYNHLIPGVGAHRLDKLNPEHLEKLYGRLQLAKDQGGKGLAAATVHLVHRTVRVALGEAMRRGHIVENVAKVAKPPRIDEDEIVPFNMEEARRILDAAADVRNGARFVVALTLGLRRGEALGSSGPISKSGGGTAARRTANVAAKPRSLAKIGGSGQPLSPSAAPYSNSCGNTDAPPARPGRHASGSTARTARNGTAGE